ncbi:unnamed protein product [Ectocarpus sp. 12 AP-2014]
MGHRIVHLWTEACLRPLPSLRREVGQSVPPFTASPGLARTGTCLATCTFSEASPALLVGKHVYSSTAVERSKLL